MIKETKKKIKKTLRKISKHKFFKNVLCNFLCIYIKLVYKTTNWKHENLGTQSSKELDNGAIFCSWHSRIIMAPAFKLHNKKANALVSLHRDGQLIAGLLKKFDFNIIGGSSTNNAKAAAVNLMKCLKNKEAVAIIPDGPKGPAQKMTISPIYYAKKTGLPIYAFAYNTKKNIIIKKSWDNLVIPLPFSSGGVVFSKPFYVPKTATEDDLEKYRKEFEKLLNKTTKKADKLAGIS